MDENTQKLQTYIHSQLQAGQAADIITAQLRQVGWPEEAIQAAFPAPAANNTAAAPRSITQIAPEQPSAVSPRTVQVRKAGRNPLTHQINGMRHVFSANPLASLGLISIIAVINLVGVFSLFVGFIVVLAILFSGNTHISHIMLAMIAASMLLYFAIVCYINLALNRLVLSNLRGEPFKVRSILRFSLRRYPLALRTFLLIGVIYIGVMIVTTLIGRMSLLLGVIASIATLLAIFIWALRLSFLAIAIVDDNTQPTVMGAIRQSAAVWKQNAFATILVLFMAMGVAFALQLILGAAPQSTALDGLSGSNLLSGITSTIISSIIATIIWVMALAGFADIYVEATDGSPKQNLLQ